MNADQDSKAAPARDSGYAPERWAFDDRVTSVFDDMLRRSIPQYDVMRRACFDIASNFARPKTVLADLGCSRGEAMAALVDKFGAYNRHVGLEVSPPMLAAARERFKGFINVGVVQIEEWDLRLRTMPPIVGASVVQAVFTLQFIPVECRQRVIQNAYDALDFGGAFILVEKVLGVCADVDELMVARYYALKEANGYSKDEIERKRLSLQGVLVPMTARWNEEMLHAAGFKQVDCFWRWMNFAGWLAVK